MWHPNSGRRVSCIWVNPIYSWTSFYPVSWASQFGTREFYGQHWLTITFKIVQSDVKALFLNFFIPFVFKCYINVTWNHSSISFISFSSYQQPIQILNFYNKFFVSLFFKYILPGKSFEHQQLYWHFLCILILIQKFYLVKYSQKIYKQKICCKNSNSYWLFVWAERESK